MDNIIYQFFICVSILVTTVNGDFKVTILHANDIKGRFEETNVNGGYCTERMQNSGTCIGGLPRMITEIKRQRKKLGKTANVFLFSGNICLGIWCKTHNMKAAIDFIKLLKPEAISLGVDEFEQAEEYFIEYVREVHNFGIPVLCSNVNVDKIPAIKDFIKKSVVLEKSGTRIGIIGYTSEEAGKESNLSSILTFLGEDLSVRTEAEKFKEQGIPVVIALGAGGFQTDEIVAMRISTIDVVVGGMSEMFLYNGDPPTPDTPEDTYPILVRSNYETWVPLVYSNPNSQYLGRLELTFNDNGHVLNSVGLPIFLSSHTEQDKSALQIINRYLPKVMEARTKPIGKVKVLLEGAEEVCFTRECNFGNLVTDSFIYYAARHLTPKSSQSWNTVSIAIYKGLYIRESIDVFRKDQLVNRIDITTALDHIQQLVLFEVHGQELKRSLEWPIDPSFSKMHLVQVSGMRLVFDPDNKLVSIKVLCANCTIPDYEDLDVDKIYRIIASTGVVHKGRTQRHLSYRLYNESIKYPTVIDAVVEYIGDSEFVYPEIDGRITFTSEKSGAAKSFTCFFQYHHYFRKCGLCSFIYFFLKKLS